ncbi:MAG: hypothetical protein ACQEWU_03000 [Bacillota bacterium]|uniref:hypothetical protein n=1 Tax=Virgibacillus TaxID=84406 RepID=UPI0003F7E495|nr:MULTISPECIES: hypothetical protein [Bacillaceae]MCC2250435.1 hypothetical protein [Virgibacillus sp. AGTR]QRZ19861.1 hypothetical protein JUJ52_09615 [Virgibacillus sp. AGTR]
MKHKKEKSNEGYTIFKPIGVKVEYPIVDLEKKQVTGTVSSHDKIYLTVLVDLKANRVHVKGNVEGLENNTMDNNAYTSMIKAEARFFVENHISNPKEYYNQFK